MRIAVASGKGGTGKTTVSVSLAQVMAEREPTTLIDCDVEEPNDHLFVRPEITVEVPVEVPVPKVDLRACDACGQCSRACRFNAIISLQTKAMVFEELCHGCGGCALVCPRRAITEVNRSVGTVREGRRDMLRFVDGRLNVGEAMAVPVIREVTRRVRNDELTILDCPPGTSCSMIAAVRGAEAGLLVTEPTPFGLNDLRLAVETFRLLEVPFGVVVNRADMGDGRVVDYCREEGIDVLLTIDEDRDIAEATSRGVPAHHGRPRLTRQLVELAEAAKELAR